MLMRKFYRKLSIEKIRNIGIIAHIDAGKTTTTERMLYYVGYTDRIGNVDDGSTVTDYLRTERERGITITSACIPLGWKDFKINLIDTPGHVDFTIEVERSLMVLDGAVTVLDGVKGVEAQTETVWRQANRYHIPRIAFINKMDRPGASIENTLNSMKKLEGWGDSILCQLPIFKTSKSFTTKDNSGGELIGVVDLIKMKQLKFMNPTGSQVIEETIDESISEQVAEHRTQMIEKLSEHDEEVVEIFLETMDHGKVPNSAILKALRRLTIEGKLVPTFCGSAFQNIGVQPILDAIVDLLPNPSESKSPNSLKFSTGSKNQLKALAFKVIYDQQRGPIVFVRVYRGRLEKGLVKTAIKERVTKLMELYADDYEEIPSIDEGNIGALIGTKSIKTGDTIVGISDKPIETDLHIPQPVFVRSIEPLYGTTDKKLDEALKYLLREDPSLVVHRNAETGQLLLSGMGELHLEIAGERLLETYKVNCKLGKVEISYRETVDQKIQHTLNYDKVLLGKHSKCTISLEIDPIESDQVSIIFDPSISIQAPFNQQDIIAAIKEGLKSASSHGPLLGFPISRIQIKATKIELFTPEISTVPAIRAASHQCLFQSLRDKCVLLEPIMKLSINVPTEYVGSVTRDMSGHRRGQVQEIVQETHRSNIHCIAPLSELVGYATILRGLTTGMGDWTMKFERYKFVEKHTQDKIISEVRGY